MKALFNCSLATAQHLCSTLVGLINPGLVGISLKKGGDELLFYDLF